jgi:hypothetical protein
MPIYTACITATISKVYHVEAPTEEQAIELAHGIFSVMSDGVDEDYDEQLTWIEERDPAECGNLSVDAVYSDD